ncbi:MAG: hypothetical protein VCC01_02270, partial [Candidatus Hydrogenedentota bacterium]
MVQIDGIFSSDLNILKGQIIQKTLTDFLIKVIPGAGWKEGSNIKLKTKFLERINDVNVEIQICSDIEK